VTDLLEALWTFFARHAYVVVLLVTTIDATGTPFPGRVLLIAAGALAASGDVSVVAMILIAAGGAVIGDHVWYLIGRWRGERILAFCCRITRRSDDCLERAKALLRRFGPFAIVIARFFTTLRIFVTAMAAGSGMPYYQYLLGEIAGALVWASLFVLLGYGAGGWLHALLGQPGGASLLPIALAGAAGVLTLAVVYRLFKRA